MANGRILRSLLCAAAAAALLASSAPAWAGGAMHYPNGAADFLAGILPPQPGFYMINYTTLIQKDRQMDDEGRNAGNLSVDVFAEVPRFIWVSPYKIGGASYGAQIFIPTYRASINGPMGVHVDEDSGLGDIIINPFILGWHFSPNFHMVTTVDIWAPTGDYDKDKLSTQILSKNHWTIEPVVAVTYLAGGLDLSAKFMYDFNTKNSNFDPDFQGPADEVDLKPGQEFHVDYGVGYGKSMEFRYGVSGYYYQQITNDKIDGDKQEKARLASAGPTFRYWPGMGKWQFTFKHLWEFGAKNTLEGQNTWLNLIYAF